MSIKKLVIIGAGQIGTSLAMAAVNNRAADEIVVYDHDPLVEAGFYKALRGASILRNKIRFTTNPTEVDGASLIVLATPTRQFAKAIEATALHVTPETIFTDVGSVKEVPIQRIQVAMDATIWRAVRPSISYVPFHILNGNKSSGAETASPDVFAAKGVLVPGHAPQCAEDLVTGFFTSLGTTVRKMSAETHDKILGTTSHLEHAIMFSVMQTRFMDKVLELRGRTDSSNWLPAMTRIAEAGPEMWRDNFLDNRREILKTAHHFKESMDSIHYAVFGENAILLKTIDETHHYAKDKPSARIRPYEAVNYKAIHGFLAFLSLTIADNARRIEKEVSWPLADLANPSFKDGLGPVAIDPESVKRLLSSPEARRGLTLADDFLGQFDKAIGLVRSRDGEGILKLVESSSEKRVALEKVFERPGNPAPRGAPSGARPG